MFGDLPSLDTHLAVIPIVVNTGAALLPALLAGVASFVALLFKPKELLQLCARKPWIPLGLFIIVGAVTALIFLWPSPAPTASRAARSPHPGTGTASGVVNIDWTKIALARIAQQDLTKAQPVANTPDTTPLIETGSSFIFRAGPQRLGVLGADLNGSLAKAWHYYPRWINDDGIEEEDTEAMILASPAYHQQRIYGASCLLDPPDSYGAIFCLDAVTGKQIWSFDTIDDDSIKGFFSSPAISADGRSLVIGQGLHPDSNCHLICLDAQTGALRWTLQVSLHIESSPAIDGDTVYVGCGAIEDPATHKPLSHPGFVLAVDLASGEERWRYDVADPESSPVVADGVLYIGSGFNGQAVVALDTALDTENRLRWRTETPYPITGAITLSGDTVIAGGGNGDFVYRDPNPAGVVLALDKKTGDILWQADLPDAVLGAVAAGPALICPVASGVVMSLDPDNGNAQWTSAISGHAPVLGACAVTDQHVYAVSQDGYLAKLDLQTGESLERHYINDTQNPGAQGLTISSPLVAQGRLYVGSETGGLRCYQGVSP